LNRTKFTSGDCEYEFIGHGKTSFVAAYAEQPGRMDSLTLNPYQAKSFLPCPFCNSQDVKITFKYANFEGTNTSGGTESTTHEVWCPHCKLYSLYASEDVTYPYD
jgi:Zn finger protein HypA/HybF involved in hydrogenase expression